MRWFFYDCTDAYSRRSVSQVSSAHIVSAFDEESVKKVNLPFRGWSEWNVTKSLRVKSSYEVHFFVSYESSQKTNNNCTGFLTFRANPLPRSTLLYINTQSGSNANRASYFIEMVLCWSLLQARCNHISTLVRKSDAPIVAEGSKQAANSG